MGKTKQAEKKFDRNVEISAPILDPEIIRAIHSPPKDQRIDVRHGGFRALLSDLNPQDSTDELAPITENHLPSYIGISCAVSGYSNYSSYGKKLVPELNSAPKLESTTSNRVTAHKLISTTSTTTSSKPNRSHTNSPVAVRADQPNIHHVTIDKSNINSIEDERKELTEKLTASATERHRSPSPIPPTEDDRHHGAYVGARYFPMPEPSKAVQKHIPLLGIDDDVNSDELIQEDVNKVEHKIASLYGDEFVEDWKESMSHRAKKEHQDDAHKQAQISEQPTKKNLKDLVTLKPTPPKKQEEVPPAIDVPTPNIKVLAGVEKQFLNRLLTDENPPMPKSPSPQPPPVSPVSSRFTLTRQLDDNREHTTPDNDETQQHNLSQKSHPEPSRSPTLVKQQDPVCEEAHEELARYEAVQSLEEFSKAPARLGQEDEAAPGPILVPDAQSIPILEPETPVTIFNDQPQEPQAGATATHDELAAQELMSEPEHLIDIMTSAHQVEEDHARGLDSPDLLGRVSEEPSSLLVETDEQNQENLFEISDDSHSEQEQQRVDSLLQPEDEHDLDREKHSRSPSSESLSRPESPSSQISRSTVERAPATANDEDDVVDKHEEVSKECDVNFSAPTREVKEAILVDEIPIEENQDDSSLVTAKEIITREADDLVSFSPEPSSEFNNNIEPVPAQVKHHDQEQEVIDSNEKEATIEKYSPELTSIQELAEGSGAIEATLGGELTSDGGADATNSTTVSGESGKIDGNYFLNLLKVEESFIMEQVRMAEQKLAEHESEMDEDRLGKIHSAIGKANLLINKKCNQFKGLCEQSLNGNANEQYAVLSDDLAGFWDMISIQIADVRKSFENL